MADLAYREVYRMTTAKARMGLIETYKKTGSISATAREWHCSRQTVRKWLERYAAEGEAGLCDRPRRPHHSPRQTDPNLEQAVLQAWQETHYGRRRLALLLRAQGIEISPHTVRHILRRHVPPQPRKRRRSLYPARRAWEEDAPCTLWQTDVKDLHDQKALGTSLIHHLEQAHLPRYQWTACEGLTRLRFLAYGQHLNRTNSLAFLLLVLCWLRAHGIDTPVAFQTDWGQEFGGTTPPALPSSSSGSWNPWAESSNVTPWSAKGTTVGWNAAIAPTTRSSTAPTWPRSVTAPSFSAGPIIGCTSTTPFGPTWAKGWTANPRWHGCAIWATLDLIPSPPCHPCSWIRSAPTSSWPVTRKLVTICWPNTVMLDAVKHLCLVLLRLFTCVQSANA